MPDIKSDREIWTVASDLSRGGPVPAIEIANKLVMMGYSPAPASAMAERIQPALDRMVASGHLIVSGPRFSQKAYSTDGCEIPPN